MRRKFPRLSKDWHVSYRIIDKAQFQQDPVSSFALNISGGGLCFESKEPLQKHALLALEIDSKEFDSPILALVRVAWCRAKGEGYTVGAEFWWIGWHNGEAQQAIANYVVTHVSPPATS